MKKLLGGVTTILVVGATIGLFINQPFGKDASKNSSVEAVTTPKVALIEAKTIEYNSLEDLQTELPLAVKGVKIEEKDTELQYSTIDNSLIGGHTVSNFKITEVLQNNEANSTIEVGNTIPIMEYSFYDKDSDTLYSYNGYYNMQKDKEYILFLLPEENGSFPIGSVSIGKIPVDSNETGFYEDELESKQEIFGDTEETIEEIEKVYEEVREEYLK